MKKLIISLCILFAIPVWASEPVNTETYQNQFVEARHIVSVETYDPCSCISFAKWINGTPQSVRWGNAWEIAPNASKSAQVGFVLLNEGISHIAYYERSGGVLKLKETNYIPCEYSEREIPIDSPKIKGFFVP